MRTSGLILSGVLTFHPVRVLLPLLGSSLQAGSLRGVASLRTSVCPPEAKSS